MDAAAITGALGKTELLGGLSDDDLGRVAAIVRKTTFPGGSPIFARGDASRSFYVVAEGSVRIYVEDPAGDQITLGVVGPFQTFGEMALFDAGPRAASAEAIDPVILLGIPRQGWLDLLDQEPTIVRHIMQSLGRSLRRYANHAVECLFLDLEGRVGRLLLQLAERLGRRDEPMRLDVVLTQGELARMVRGSRQSVNQVLRRLEASGYVRSESGELVITDREGLHARASVER
jgi:CRP-like cAMP-binding protein